jgi:hypothetical protein
MIALKLREQDVPRWRETWILMRLLHHLLLPSLLMTKSWESLETSLCNMLVVHTQLKALASEDLPTQDNLSQYQDLQSHPADQTTSCVAPEKNEAHIQESAGPSRTTKTKQKLLLQPGASNPSSSQPTPRVTIIPL